MHAHDPQRLGFPVKVLARPDLKSNDSRRWKNAPHLKVSLEYLDAILDHCAARGIRMYRMSSDLAPYATHPDMPQFHGMVEDSAGELAAIGAKAERLDVRLSFHPPQFILLNTPDEAVLEKSVNDLASSARILDLMGLGPEAVIVIHVGGTYGDREASRARWAATWDRLPEPVRRRLVLENDDIRFSATDTLWIHERTGVPLVFDHQHWWCLHEPEEELVSAFAACLATWPDGVRPKMHFSSPRTETRMLERKDRKTGKPKLVPAPPIWTGHADYVQPFEFIRFLRDAEGLVFDVMIEAKQKDLALERLRADLARYAPDVAARFGVEGASEAAE
ncbi:UV-damage endonuclease [Hasllibacter halocynthiae]|uniref:UV-damage endonuclease n=2 Tax=Hasllibacter halocynthiae TaxID=595589 RepID=A0A2T0X321_9RHOB|nr:UV-damage endonuclease [Hasllibacter halocynthiae]